MVIAHWLASLDPPSGHSRGAAGTPRVAIDMLSVRWCSLDHAMVLTAAVLPSAMRQEVRAVCRTSVQIDIA